MKPIMNLEELQEKVGLLENDQGIVYLSLFNTDLYDLLSPYIETVDYRLYFDFANRIVIGKYEKAVSTSKLSILKKAIYYALKGEEYNLKTLINTTNLDYNPLENYKLHETIVSTSSISALMKYGQMQENTHSSKTPYDIVTSTSYGSDVMSIQKSMPKRQETTLSTIGARNENVNTNSTITTGAQDNIKTDKISYAELEKNITETNNQGERTSQDNSEHTVSAYNAGDYQPSNKDTTNNTTNAVTDTKTTNDVTNAHIDMHDITDNLGERIDKKEENVITKKEETFDQVVKTVSEITDVDTHTRNPRTDNETQKIGQQENNISATTLEHENENKQNEDGNRQRDLHGRYGFNTVQTMIESERKLANLNISDKIIDIIIHTICEGVLYLW